MRGYKILFTRTPHLCYECTRVISPGSQAVVDLALYGHIKGSQAYFHLQCYKDSQLTPQEVEEFEKAVLFNLVRKAKLFEAFLG